MIPVISGAAAAGAYHAANGVLLMFGTMALSGLRLARLARHPFLSVVCLSPAHLHAPSHRRPFPSLDNGLCPAGTVAHLCLDPGRAHRAAHLGHGCVVAAHYCTALAQRCDALPPYLAPSPSLSRHHPGDAWHI